MLQAPTFTTFIETTTGDEPLGSAIPNERLIAQAIPGINNVVRHIRVYSAICWMVRQIHAKGQNSPDLDMREISRAGMAKIQLLLTWFGLEEELKGLAGASRQFPKDNKPVILDFQKILSKANQNRKDNEESNVQDGMQYTEAVQYGPSLFNGLRFLNGANDDDIPYLLTQAGEDLADAYEHAIRGHARREWLRDPMRRKVRHEEVLDMGTMLSLKKPSDREKKAFLAQYYPKDAPTEDSIGWGNRQATLSLVLLAIREESRCASTSNTSGVSLEAIRYAMARGTARDGTSIVEPGLERVQQWWAELQLRQYFRAGHDLLFRVCEQWILFATAHKHPHNIDDCAEAIASLVSEVLPVGYSDRVAQTVSQFEKKQADCLSLYTAGLRHSQLDLQVRRAGIEAVRNSSLTTENQIQSAVREAYLALIFSAVECGNFLKTGHKLRTTFTGRLTLDDLRELVLEKFRESSPKGFLAHFVKHHVLLQHFHVAQERTTNESSRARIAVGDMGLERVSKAKRVSAVNVLPDRLLSGLRLLAECDIVDVHDLKTPYFQLTEKGGAYLDEVLRNLKQ